MITEKLNFSVILSDLSEKYIIDEKIKPKEFIQKLCECQNESIIFNDSSRLVWRFTVYLLVAHYFSGVTTCNLQCWKLWFSLILILMGHKLWHLIKLFKVRKTFLIHWVIFWTKKKNHQKTIFGELIHSWLTSNLFLSVLFFWQEYQNRFIN